MGPCGRSFLRVGDYTSKWLVPQRSNFRVADHPDIRSPLMMSCVHRHDLLDDIEERCLQPGGLRSPRS
jgi:hypothetical protein